MLKHTQRLWDGIVAFWQTAKLYQNDIFERKSKR